MATREGWICDACGGVIDEARDGWVEWVVVSKGGGFHGRDLRLVHHVPASPRGPGGRCQFDRDAEHRSDGGRVRDLPLGEFLGADGLMRVLEMLSEGVIPAAEMIELTKRLHVPGYEHARLHLEEAVEEGVFDPNTKAGFPRAAQIERVLDWLDERAE